MSDVSIIITTFNDKFYLQKAIASILNDNQNDLLAELIVVDNGSTDGTVEWATDRKEFKFLREVKHLDSPYSCRNRGIESATGQIIVLLDSTCVPKKGWLNHGLMCLERERADIIGGNVLFDFERNVTGAKLYDAMTNIKMEESIKKGVAKTANLFIRKSVFDKIGLFPEGIRSGGDVRWTYKATSKGMKLVFCSEAIVYKPARGFKELLKKQWRVGLHQPLIWRELAKQKSRIRMLAQIVTPVNPLVLRKSMREKFGDEAAHLFVPFLFTAQLSKSVMGLANLIGSFKKK